MYNTTAFGCTNIDYLPYSTDTVRRDRRKRVLRPHTHHQYKQCSRQGLSVARRSDLYGLAGQGLMGPGMGSKPTQGPGLRLAVRSRGCNKPFWGWYSYEYPGR
jgi:hypothetical protein